MMTAFLLYIGKVAVLLAVFYLFYRLLMERETFHRFNRAVLLISVLVAFILPLCEVTLHQTIIAELSPNIGTTSTNEIAEPNANYLQQAFRSLVPILFSIFFLGVVIKILHTLFSVYRIRHFIRYCEHHPQIDGTEIAVCSEDVTPFSWWNTIVFSRKDYELHDPALLAHEQAHINGYHSFDLLLMEFAIAFQWFNPAIWLIGRELRTVHEYEADSSVLSGGVDTHHYLTLLMERANAKHSFILANSISQKTLKNRFQMMARHRSKPLRLLKVLYLLPIVAITLTLNAQTIIHYQTHEPAPTHPLADTIQASAPQEVVPSPAVKTNKQQNTQKSEPQSETTLITISGTVLDEQGSPIIGAIVLVHDSTLGTVTDFDGCFSIKVPKGSVLDMMYIGVAAQSIACNEDVSNLKVTLIKDNS